MKLNEREKKILGWQLDKYSLERKKFLRDTEHEDILMVILRTHMYIEREMIELTGVFFKHDGVFKNYKFKSRLDLLFALGVIEKELYDPIKKINDIRNDISHKLDFEFTEEKYKNLCDSLSNSILIEYKKDLELAISLSKDLNYIDKTKILLSCTWTSLKADILTSFIKKRMLANEYEMQAIDILKELEKEISEQD